MHRSAVLLLTLALALATAIALLGAATALTDPPVSGGLAAVGADGAVANAAVVRQFYAAVNEILRTGETTALDRLVAADLVDHAARPGLAATRDGMVAYLVGLRPIFPAMRLSVEALIAQGDQVMARVRVDGTERGAFLGIPVAGEPAVWGPFDLFRMAGGAIVEHWGSRDAAPRFRSLTQASLPPPGATAASIQVERLTYAPGSAISVRRNTQLRVVSLEAGTLDVRIDGAAVLDRSSPGGDPGAAAPVPVDGEVRLRRGDLLVVPADAAYVARNDGEVPARSVEVSVLPPRPLTPLTDRIGTATSSAGVSAQFLAATIATAPGEPAMVEIGRATLPPGGSIAAHTTAGPELFLVESGSLGVHHAGSGDEHGPGDVALVARGERVSYLNAGETPLVALVVAFSPGRG